MRFALLLALLFCWPALAQPTVAGFTPGSFRVTESGAAEYRVPLRVPPGIAGMEPKLALVYNSQAGNGLLGVGWSLEGLSSITRCARTMAQDGVRGGVNYDANDRFCLDGQRLMAISGTYGAEGTEYRTERESFSRVISFGQAGSGPAWFKVWTKSGQVMEYGNTADSRIEAQGKSTVRVWAVGKVSDSRGNYLNLTYSEDTANGEFYPSRVDYTGASAAAPALSVQFTYASRSDPILQHHAGSIVRMVQRLINVRSFAGATLVADHRLAYDNNGVVGRSRVVSVSHCDAAGACLPATSLQWRAHGDGFGTTYSTGVIDWGLEAGRAWADFNGDGKADFCRLVGTVNGQSSYARCIVSTGNGFGDTYSSDVLDWGLESGRAWVDVNGDGKADFCRLVGTVNGQSSYARCTLSTGTGFGATITSGVIDWGWDSGRTWVDFNGDGMADFCRFVGSSQVQCTVSTGVALGDTYTSPPIDLGLSTGRAWVDFNGDGKADFCRLVGSVNGESSYARCNPSTGTGFGELHQSGVIDWGLDEGRAWADVNGDGKADFCRLVGSVNGESSWARCLLSTGQGFGDNVTSGVVDWGVGYGRYWVDFNGDGKADYCRFVGNHQLQCTVATGAGLSSTYGSGASDWGLGAGRAWADFDGDGKAEFCRLVGTTNGESSYARCTVSSGALGDFVSRISAGSGAQLDLAYQPLTNAAVYTKGATAAYPETDLQNALYVVSSVGESNGISGTMTTNYQYAGAKASHHGRGFLGFRVLESTNQQSGLKARTENRQDWPCVGMPSLVRKSQDSGAALGETTHACSCTNPATGSACTVAAGNRYFPFVSQSVESGNDLNGAALPTVTTTIQYDGFGNPTSIAVSTPDGHARTTTNTFVPPDTVNWVLGRPARSTMQSTSP